MTIYAIYVWAFMNRLFSFATGLLHAKYFTKVTYFLHTVVTFIYIVCYIYSSYVIWISDNVYVQHRFVKNGVASMGYLLSIWTVFAESIYFCSYSVIDVLEMYYSFYKKSEEGLLVRLFISHYITLLRNIARYILFSVVFPLSVVVAIMFWGFYFWDRELMYPKIMDDILPSFINHMMHTYPVLLSMLYMFIEIEEEPPKMEAYGLLTILMSTYSLVFFYGNSNCDEWVYPVLNALSPSQTTMVLIFTATTPYVYLNVGYSIYSKIKDARSYLKGRVQKSKKY